MTRQFLGLKPDNHWVWILKCRFSLQISLWGWGYEWKHLYLVYLDTRCPNYSVWTYLNFKTRLPAVIKLKLRPSPTMMELSTEKTNGSVHHPFVYPTDLRVLGYSAGSSATVQVMSPPSPNVPIVTTPNGSFTLPRNLLFSDSEVLLQVYFMIFSNYTLIWSLLCKCTVHVSYLLSFFLSKICF